MVIALVILASLVFCERETFRDANFGNHSHWNRFFIRFSVPVLVGFITWSWQMAALSFSVFYLVFDPLLNLRRGKGFFHTDPGTWEQVISGERSFYDVIDGRIALLLEVIFLIFIIYQL